MQNLQKQGEKTKVEKEGGLLARQSGENHHPWWENTGGASVKQFRKPQSFFEYIAELGLWKIDPDVTFFANLNFVVHEL